MQGCNATWSHAVGRWSTVLRAANRAPGTIDTRTGHIAQFARWANPRRLDEIDDDIVLTFVGEHEWSAAFRRSMYQSLQQFFRWAHGSGLLESDPALHLPKVTPSRTHRAPASEDAVWTAWSKATEREKLIMRLASEHGLRRTEIALVHANDVLRDVVGWLLVVHGKGAKDRYIPIDNSFALELLRAGSSAGWVFPGNFDGHLSPRWIGTLISRLLPGEDTIHSLRHRFAHVTFQSSGNVRAVQEALGHANLNTTQIYLPGDIGIVRDAMSRARAYLAPQPPNVRHHPINTPSPIQLEAHRHSSRDDGGLTLQAHLPLGQSARRRDRPS